MRTDERPPAGSRDAGRRALALIIVVGVLAVLAVLATSFVMMAELERKASTQRLISTKAYFLARSGIEDALARLAVGQDPMAGPNLYQGEDWDGSGGALSVFEADQEVYQAGTANRNDCPLRYAMRPSFYTLSSPGIPASNPARIRVDNRERGYSGLLHGEHQGAGNTYAFKVEDESTKINVNSGFLDALDRDMDATPDHRDTWVSAFAGVKDPGRGWNGSLTRVLNVLGAQPEIGIPALGDAVIANRPDGGYRSIAELQSAIGTSKDLSPYLTTRSWIDAKVVHPNGYATQNTALVSPTSPAGMNDIKRDRPGTLALEENGRPPVNLNGASRPILAALIQDLRGTSWQAVGAPRVYQINAAMAGAIADQIIAYRATTPFGTWGEFSAFCDALVDTGVITGMIDLAAVPPETHGAGNLCGADLLKANFDPNTDLNKNLPDQLLFHWVDKSDLSVWSTEGSLGPTGTFLLSSLGRVLDRNGRLLASRSLSVNVELFRPLRQTTQKDFVAGRALDQYLSLGPPGGTLGMKTTGCTASWNTWGAGTGLAAITYPCAPTALPAKASAVDGCIGLATVQAADTAPAQGPLKFMHHLDDSLDADVGSPVARLPGIWDAGIQTDLTEDIWPPSSVEPSTFLPDGLHGQIARSPGYPAAGNFPAYSAGGNHAVFGYWVKMTNLQKPVGATFPAGSSCLEASEHIVCSRVVDLAKNSTQTLVIASGEFSYGRWGITMENSVDSKSDVGREREVCASADAFVSQALKPSLRWHFVSAWFDTNEASLADEVGMWIRGVRAFARKDTYYTTPYSTKATQDLLAPGVPFVLGTNLATLFAGGANQIMDEVAIYDFGDTGLATDGLAGILADNRYADGRYYKGDDARFLSDVLEPDPASPSRLLSVRWTEYLPKENRQEILVKVTGMGSPAIPDKGIPRLIDPFLLTSRLEISLLDEFGNMTSAPLQALSQGASIGRKLQRFRYRVRFVNPPADLNQGVLETPFLDDITFLWQPASGPRITYWQER